MKEQPLPSNENPSDDLAAQLDEILSHAPSAALHNAASENVVAGHVSLQDASVRSVKATAVRLEDAVAGIVRTGSFEATDSVVGWAVAREATLRTVTNSVLAATRVQADEVHAFAVIAGRVDGNVKTAVTPWMAFAAGAGFAAVMLLVNALLGRRGGKQ